MRFFWKPDDAKADKEQEQADIDRHRQREAGQPPLERRPIVGRGEAIGWQVLGKFSVASA